MSDSQKVIDFPKVSPAVATLERQLKAVIYQYAGRVSVAEVIGTLEVVKMEVMEKQA